MQWQTLVSGVTPNDNLFGESSFWTQKFRRLYLEHRPFKELDQIVGISRRIAKGSRLPLLLSSPNSIHAQKNYNSGAVVSEESGKDARIAHVTVYHDSEHPSFLEIPIVQ